MSKSHSFSWILVVGLVVVGLINLGLNPFAMQTLRAEQDCSGDPPTCQPCHHSECIDGDWECVADPQPTCQPCQHCECQNGAWVCVDDY